MSSALMPAHVNSGALATLAAVWLFAEALNASEKNRQRIRIAGITVTALLLLTWALAGYWYTRFYGPDREMILNGPMPWAHSLVMETKEHIFYVSLILALYLPFITRRDLATNKMTRRMTLTVSALIVLLGLIMENAGGLIGYGIRSAYMAETGG